VQLLSHFHTGSYPEGDQVGHETLLPILCNHHFFLNNTENFCGHSGSNVALFLKPGTKTPKILAAQELIMLFMLGQDFCLVFCNSFVYLSVLFYFHFFLFSECISVSLSYDTPHNVHITPL
jgi:hypothetical protein